MPLIKEPITPPSRQRILLGQLGSFGDCLYATTIAHQIKVDYPGCHLTWAIGSLYRSILVGNPHVDEVWERPLSNRSDLIRQWRKFETEALERKEKGDFDIVFLTQVFPGNLKNFDGTLRSSIFRAYPSRISVPIAPIVQLTKTEISNVCRYAELHHLTSKKHVVLFECLPESEQSFVTPSFAREVAQALASDQKDVAVILSSSESIYSNSNQVVDGSVLTFRENLKLMEYCDLIVGCSSGLSWLATSSSLKNIPTIQLLERRSYMFASFVHDHKYHGLDTEHILEMTNCTTQTLVDCVELALTSGIGASKRKYGEAIPVKFSRYWHSVMGLLFDGNFKDFFRTVSVTYSRWGFRLNFLSSFFLVFLVHLRQRVVGKYRRLISTG